MALNFNGTDVGTLKMGTTDIANVKMGSTDVYNNEIIILKIPNISSNTGHIAAAFVIDKKIILQTAYVKYENSRSVPGGTMPATHNITYKNIVTFNANNQSPKWVSKTSTSPINHRASTLVGNHIISFRRVITRGNVKYISGSTFEYDETSSIQAYNYDTSSDSFKTTATWTQSTMSRLQGKGDNAYGLTGDAFEYVVDWYNHPILYMFSYGSISGFEISSGYDYINNTFSSPTTKSIMSSKSFKDYTIDANVYFEFGNIMSHTGFNYCAKVLKTNNTGNDHRYSKILIGGYSHPDNYNNRGVVDAGLTNKIISINIPLQTGNYHTSPKAAIRRIFPAEPCQYDGYTYYGQYRKSGDLWYMEDFTGFSIFKPSSSDIDETTPILSVVFNNELVYFNQYTGDVYQWNKKRWLKNGTVIS